MAGEIRFRGFPGLHSARGVRYMSLGGLRDSGMASCGPAKDGKNMVSASQKNLVTSVETALRSCCRFQATSSWTMRELTCCIYFS